MPCVYLGWRHLVLIRPLDRGCWVTVAFPCLVHRLQRLCGRRNVVKSQVLWNVINAFPIARLERVVGDIGWSST